ncbi:hypothetical protein [Natronobacterium texcoconense]|uniref:Uncharacterized protein n=1 Tax=Natronobacterium texcoconense TaxID=1095778 RepID=A0A1H1IR00_NATTX|nr:hypothetical protein [Natronobacterium texcoconense]SDR40134.1 hypothetical protein SAMN04489842_3741 [Natronobacterium texcoconense]
MSPSRPFFDAGELDTSQLFAEAYPIAELIASFALLAFVPFAVAFVFAGLGFQFGTWLFTVLTQLVLAVGAGVVLLYIVARGIQLADE